MIEPFALDAILLIFRYDPPSYVEKFDPDMGVIDAI
jgi:hypothetical protein